MFERREEGASQLYGSDIPLYKGDLHGKVPDLHPETFLNTPGAHGTCRAGWSLRKVVA